MPRFAAFVRMKRMSGTRLMLVSRSSVASTLYKKEEPPGYIGIRALPGDERLDFILRHSIAGPLGIECKNVRNWLYPCRREIIDTIRKCLTLNCVPVVVARRVRT